jgi:XrtJ-associated TM-motif-TM protein
MSKTVYVFALLVLLAFSASLHAQGGCTDSPEAPTGLLLLIGSAGMFCGSFVLKKVRHYRDCKKS